MMFNIREKLAKLKYDTIKKIAYWKSTGDARIEYDKNRELKAYLQQCEEAWGTPAFRALYERLDPLTYQTNWEIDHKNLDRLYALDCKAFRKYWNRRIIPDWKYDARLRSMSHHLERWFPYRYDKKLCNEYYGRHNVTDLETLEPKYRLRMSYEIWNDRIYWSDEELREKVIQTIEERASRADVAAELKVRLPHVAASHVVVPVPNRVPGSRSPKLSLDLVKKKDISDAVRVIPAREAIEEILSDERAERIPAMASTGEEVSAVEELSLKVKDPDDDEVTAYHENDDDDRASLLTLDEGDEDADQIYDDDDDYALVTIYDDDNNQAITLDEATIDDEVMMNNSTDDGDTPLTIHDDDDLIDDPSAQSNYDDNDNADTDTDADQNDNNKQFNQKLKVPMTLPKCCSYDAMASYQPPTATRLPHSISASALIIMA